MRITGLPDKRPAARGYQDATAASAGRAVADVAVELLAAQDGACRISRRRWRELQRELQRDHGRGADPPAWRQIDISAADDVASRLEGSTTTGRGPGLVRQPRRDAGVGWCLIGPPPRYPNCCEKWSTRARGAATASSGTTGARASTRRRPARSSSRTRPPSGRGDGWAPLSIARPRTRVRSRRRVGRSRSSVHGCATRRHWGWAADRPKPGARCSGSRPDSHPGTDRQV
jgi:hypothetical protein